MDHPVDSVEEAVGRVDKTTHTHALTTALHSERGAGRHGGRCAMVLLKMTGLGVGRGIFFASIARCRGTGQRATVGGGGPLSDGIAAYYFYPTAMQNNGHS